MGGAPYYQDSYRDALSNSAVRFFFKYNNDNNPYPIVTLSPVTVFGGLSSIGGAIKMFGLLKIVLYLYNKSSFERRVLKACKHQIAVMHRQEIIDQEMI